MDPEKRKLIALGAVIVVAVGVLVVRTVSALRETDEGSGVEELTVERLGTAPAADYEVMLTHHPERPAVPHLKLATLRHHGSREHHVRAIENRKICKSVWTALRDLRVNAFMSTLEEPEDDGDPDADAVLRVEALLLYADRPSSSDVALGETACLITKVHADSSAEAGGMRVGDLLWDVDGRGLDHLGCKEITARTLAAAPNTDVKVSVIRAGRRVELTLSRPGKTFGFDYLQVPVLAPDQVAVASQYSP